MILGAALATLAGGGDGSAVIGAAAGLTLGFIFIRFSVISEQLSVIKPHCR
jgi:positive regulator of sigma E activity